MLVDLTIFIYMLNLKLKAIKVLEQEMNDDVIIAYLLNKITYIQSRDFF